MEITSNSKRKYVARVFTVSIGDLIFQVQPNQLLVAKNENGSQVLLTTEVKSDDLEVLEAFANKAQTILSPIPKSEIIYSISEGVQKITLFKTERNTYVLIINEQIQFTTDSEVIYHEALVSPAIASFDNPKSFLILGGGDGLAAKQIFREVPNAKITLVDFDKNITDIFTKDPVMCELNEFSMQKCEVINDDAYSFVQTHSSKYDIIICDFPDPDDEIFNKLYSLEFYSNLKKLLNDEGILSVQSGSLVMNSECFSCINRTIEHCGFKTLRYYTPTSYGELVYSMGKLNNAPKPLFNDNLKTITQDFFDKAMTTFRPDQKLNAEVEINTKDNFAALNYRLKELKLDNGEKA
jgi:spermidine synthase